MIYITKLVELLCKSISNKFNLNILLSVQLRVHIIHTLGWH